MRYDELPVLSGATPPWGHLRMMQRDRMGFVRRIEREVTRLTRVIAIGPQAVIVNDPEVLHELLVEKARVFEKSLLTRFALYPLGGEGLFTSKGDLWRGQRKLMAPLFQPAALRTYADDMVACALRGMAELRDGQVIEVAKLTTRITMSVAGKTLFDADTFSEADEIGAALTVALDWTVENAPSALSLAHLMTRKLLLRAAEVAGPSAPEIVRNAATALEAPVFVPGSEGRRLRRAIQRLDRHVANMIAARRADSNPPDDLLTRLLRARDEAGARMSDKQVRDEVLTLFVAGHETTATGLAWSLHCLCRNASVRVALEREVDALEGDPTFEDVERLPLTLRVFKEALRLYPPVYLFARQSAVATSLDDCELDRDVVATICPWALHRRPDLWPDPERFDPDRFLPEAEASRPRLAWLPFGAGPRTCIGNHFAMMEGQLVLATLLRRARFEPAGDEVPEPSATLRPLHRMPMRVHLRG